MEKLLIVSIIACILALTACGRVEQQPAPNVVAAKPAAPKQKSFCDCDDKYMPIASGWGVYECALITDFTVTRECL